MALRISDLPFVNSPPAGPRDFWRVKSSGEYAQDCDLGRNFADSALALMSLTHKSPLLGLIAAAIAKKGQFGGIETGFFQRVAERAIST
jgi:hypothetical protein